jgi:hypothetical protein
MTISLFFFQRQYHDNFLKNSIFKRQSSCPLWVQIKDIAQAFNWVGFCTSGAQFGVK